MLIIALSNLDIIESDVPPATIVEDADSDLTVEVFCMLQALTC